MKLRKLLFSIVIVSLLVSMAIPMASAKKPGGGGGKPGGGIPNDPAIAYKVAGDGIYVMDADGSHQARVVNDEWASGVTFSPDGLQLVFQTGTGGMGIWVINMDGTGLTQIATKTSGYVAGTSWSPSVTATGDYWIAFTDEGVDGRPDVFLVKPDGSGKMDLTNSITTEYYPVWNQAGDKLLVKRYNDPDNLRDVSIIVYTMGGEEGGVPTIISEQDITNVDGSPLQGKQPSNPSFAHTTNDVVVHASAEGSPDIYLIDLADPANPVDVTGPNDRPEMGGCLLFDDSKIIYQATMRKKNAIYSANPDGSGEVELGWKMLGPVCRPW